jgi:hypothetical protein
VSRAPTQAEVDRALALFSFLQYEAESSRPAGSMVTVVYGGCEVVGQLERPKPFKRAVKILHDNSPVHSR